MKVNSILSLQILVVLIGLAALTFLIWEPHVEGRNVDSTVFEIYFHDPFLAYAYFASIPFFVGVYQTFRALGYARKGQSISPTSLQAVRTIKYCAASLIFFAAVGVLIIMLNTSDDRAGGVAMGVLFIFGCIAVSITSALFERYLKRALIH